MRKTIWSSRFALALGMAVLGGCQNPLPYPDDPLLAGNHPETGRFDKPEPVQVAAAEPSMPSLPAEAYVSLPPAFRMLPHSAPTALAASPRVSEPAAVAEQSPTRSESSKPNLAPREVEALPVARHREPGVYGHAPDHSWLQGRIEQGEAGKLLLRYCNYPLEDSWGGVVVLDNDERLGQVRVGDVVRVVGSSQTVDEIADRGTRSLPSFRVRDLWLIERKD